MQRNRRTKRFSFGECLRARVSPCRSYFVVTWRQEVWSVSRRLGFLKRPRRRGRGSGGGGEGGGRRGEDGRYIMDEGSGLGSGGTERRRWAEGSGGRSAGFRLRKRHQRSRIGVKQRQCKKTLEEQQRGGSEFLQRLTALSRRGEGQANRKEWGRRRGLKHERDWVQVWSQR